MSPRPVGPGVRFGFDKGTLRLEGPGEREAALFCAAPMRLGRILRRDSDAYQRTTRRRL